MRKLLLGTTICLLAVTWAGMAEAQTAGIKFGRIWSEFDGETGSADESFARRSDWAAGLFLRFGLGPMALQAEALYAKRGTELEGAPGNPEVRMTYLEVPLLLRIGSGATALYGGGYGARKLDAIASDELSGSRIETDISSEIEDFDYGLMFGVSLGFGAVEIDGRYTMGMANLVKDPAAPELKHRAISVLAGITF